METKTVGIRNINENITLCGLKIKNNATPAMIIKEPQRGFHQIIIYPNIYVKMNPVGLSSQLKILVIFNSSIEPINFGPNKPNMYNVIKIP